MSHPIIRRCRPYLFTNYLRSHRQIRVQTYSQIGQDRSEQDEGRDVTNDYTRRVAQLARAKGDLEKCYPLLGEAERMQLKDFVTKYGEELGPNETRQDTSVTVAGTLR